MIESNFPIDIGKNEIAGYKEPVEELLNQYSYGGKTQTLPDLLQSVDHVEQYVIGSLEREVYIVVREGLQIFSAINDKLQEKTDLRKLIVGSRDVINDPEIRKRREFGHNFAVYASSTYISKRLETLLHESGYKESEERDFSHIDLDTATPTKSVQYDFVGPMMAGLLEHHQQKARGSASFSSAEDFVSCVNGIFKHQAALARTKRNQHSDLSFHLDGYTFNIMDGFVELEGYNDRSTAVVSSSEDKPTFQPITNKEIVGNHAAKRKLERGVDLLCLYNTTAQMNAVMELGGLAWTTLLDGFPGTGKTSLFRRIMTRLAMRAAQIDLPYNIAIIDQSIKTKWYGDTGHQYLQKLAPTNDPNAVTIVFLDDLDLLSSSRGDAAGGDNDINNITMQYLDGALTVRRGNVMNFAASNEPTGLEAAVRNRMNDRFDIPGPETAADFADMVMLFGKPMLDAGLLIAKLGYTPFATQDIQNEDGTWTGGDVQAYKAEEFDHYRDATIFDFGTFMAELKERNERITGRSMNAIMQSAMARAANFNVPNEWFEDRSLFIEQPLETQKSLIQELYTPITPDVLFQEAQRYFDSEERYRNTEEEGAITAGYNNLRWQMEAELKVLEEELKSGEAGTLVPLEAARANRRSLTRKTDLMVQRAHAKAKEKAEEAA